MINFRVLSHFVAACEHENLSSAAQEIGISPSTLSASLKSLEHEFSVSLFRRHENGLTPRRLAHPIYRAAVSLLLLEDFARRRASRPGAPIRRLTINIRLRFAFGQLRRALARTILDTAEEDPLLFIDTRWPLEGVPSLFATPLDGLGFAQDHELTIEAITRAVDPAAGEIILRHDKWMLVRRTPRGNEIGTAQHDTAQTWMVPVLPPGLIRQITAYAAERGRVLRIGDVQLDDWPQMLEDFPRAAFPLPASAIGRRLGLSNVASIELDPPIHATLVARTDHSPEAIDLLSRLQAALETETSSKAFDPELTDRGTRYFNLAYEAGRVSAAARSAGIAQPAMSQQLRKLEETLGVELFGRNAFGLVRTDAADQFAVASRLLEARLRELETRGALAALEEGGRLSLGILPSGGHLGVAIDAVNHAVLALRQHYPETNLDVREGSGEWLQGMVAQGRIGIAIVDAAPSTIPRIAMDWEEPLVVVTDPGAQLLAPGPVRFADLVRLPLILPTLRAGVRKILESQARDLGLHFKPRHEIDALAMTVGLIAREPIGAILPVSVVESEELAGRFAVHPIHDPAIFRQLYVLHSGQRSLSPAEREFVRLLREALDTHERRQKGWSAFTGI